MKTRMERWKKLVNKEREIKEQGREVKQRQKDAKTNWFAAYDRHIKRFLRKAAAIAQGFEDKAIKIVDMGYTLIVSYENNHIRFDHNGLSMAGNGRVKITSNRFFEKEIIFSEGREWVIDESGIREKKIKLLDEKALEKYMISGLIGVS
jgi:hypothetical protein